MSDKSYYTVTSGSDRIPTFKSNVEASLGQARLRTWKSITNSDTPYTATDDEDYIDCDCTSGAIEVDLPASPTSGDEFVVRKSDASGNAVTVDGNGNNINGSASASLASQYDTGRYSYNGTEWAEV